MNKVPSSPHTHVPPLFLSVFVTLVPVSSQRNELNLPPTTLVLTWQHFPSSFNFYILWCNDILFLFMLRSFRHYSSSLCQQKLLLSLCKFSVVSVYINNGAYVHFSKNIIVNQLTFAIMYTKWNISSFRIGPLGLCAL